MNIRHMVASALVFAGLGVIAGCSMDATTDDADDALSPIGETSQAIAGAPLIYGQAYTIKNGYINFSGGYLDTRGVGCQQNQLCVSTATTSQRDGGSGTWLLTSANGKTPGTVVEDGDNVYLLNMHDVNIATGTNGGYLDVREAGCQGNGLCVSTAYSPNRDNGSGTWKIQIQNRAVHPSNQVFESDVVVFRNGFGDFAGGWLDTRENWCEGNQLCVSTSATRERDSGSTYWRLLAAGAF